MKGLVLFAPTDLAWTILIVVVIDDEPALISLAISVDVIRSNRDLITGLLAQNPVYYAVKSCLRAFRSNEGNGYDALGNLDGRGVDAHWLRRF